MTSTNRVRPETTGQDTAERDRSQQPTETASNTVPRVALDALTAAEFAQHYQRPGKPVIVTGLLAGESEWDLDYLSQQFGSRDVLARFYGRDRYQQDKREWTNIGSGVGLRSVPFDRYAEMLRDGTAREQDVYLAKHSLNETPLANPAVLQRLETALGLTKAATGWNLWAGPGGHLECLHYDPMDGTLIQMHGEKKVLLFPPSQTYNLYPFPVYAHFRHGLNLRCWFSQVYPEQPDFDAFPKLREALQHKQEIILRPGELLYIPAGWWHEVTALGEGLVCSVNRFWGVTPLMRSLTCWSKWRAYSGSACAIPYTLGRLAMALFSPNRKQQISKILHQI